MPLAEPPEFATVTGLPRRRLVGTTLFRVHRRDRVSPWWFATASDDAGGGRFDLPAPHGTCYLATSPIAALLEAFQGYGRGLLPESELRRRTLAEVDASDAAPDAADLASRRSRGAGVTAALWAGGDRALTQRWAAALRRAGWLAVHHGVQHDPEGRLRGVALFDHAGEHPPYDDEGWAHREASLHDDALVEALGGFGIELTRSDATPNTVALDDTDLLES